MDNKRSGQAILRVAEFLSFPLTLAPGQTYIELPLIMRHVYLDHLSTTPVLPEVFEAMAPFFNEAFGSPSSLHRQGLRARDALDKARAQVAALVHAESAEDIIFTSGGTE